MIIEMKTPYFFDIGVVFRRFPNHGPRVYLKESVNSILKYRNSQYQCHCYIFNTVKSIVEYKL